jgi:hypothetical protein
MTRGWGRPFEEPIEVDGRKLVTLRSGRDSQLRRPDTSRKSSAGPNRAASGKPTPRGCSLPYARFIARTVNFVRASTVR